MKYKYYFFFCYFLSIETRFGGGKIFWWAKKRNGENRAKYQWRFKHIIGCYNVHVTLTILIVLILSTMGDR